MFETPIPFAKFTNLTNRLYRNIGMIAYEENGVVRESKWFDLAFILLMLNLNSVLLGEVAFVIMALKNQTNFVEATLNLSFIASVIVADVKIWNIWRKKSTLTQFMGELQNMFPKSAHEQAAYETAQYLRRYKLVTVPYVWAHNILLWVYNLFVLSTYYVYSYVMEDKTTERTLPFLLWLPWNFSDNWSFFALFASEAVAGQTCFFGQLASDVLLCMSATQIAMHYRYLAQRIERYEPGQGANAALNDMDFICHVAEYHQKILFLSDVMNDIFGISLLWNCLLSSPNICFVAFVTTTGNTDLLVMLVMYLLCSLSQVFLIGTYSQKLIETSEQVGQAICNHDWFNADKRYRKMLSLIIQRSQQPTMLKATNLLPISLATVAQVIQISYKFFALLRTIYTK